MLSQSNINEVNRLLEHNNIKREDHEHIVQQIQYDMWEFKARESNAKQREELNKIQKSALYLLKNLQSISWELSAELHEQLENEYRSCELLDEEDVGNYDEEFEDIDLKFRRALEENADKLTLQFLYNEGLEDAFGNVPINGAANAIDYVSRLANSCKVLVDRKVDSKDKGLYPTLQTRWEMIGEKYNIEVTKTNSIEFISACTGKDVETTKKQYQRLGVVPSSTVEEEAKAVLTLEGLIFERYVDDWHRLFSMPNFLKSGCGVTIHWILVDLFQEQRDAYVDFKAYLQDVYEKGIRDIIRKYE